jgi:hypothetical protein
LCGSRVASSIATRRRPTMAAASLPLALLVAVAASPPQGSHCANHSAGCWFNRAGKNCSAANSERDCGAQLVCLRDLCRQCTADSECNYSERRHDPAT